jgi:transcriptional regulator with XRE-family HTH domain/predicted negative regulator of RcsB-dependent stress response
MMPVEPGHDNGTAPKASLGARVHTLRTRAGLSQAELAEAAGMSGSYISLIEAGQRSPRKETLDRLSRALRVSRAELLGSVPASPMVIEMELAQAQSDIEAGKLPGALRKLDSLLRRYSDSITVDMECRIRLARGTARCQAGDVAHGLAELEDLLAGTVPADMLGSLLRTLAACYLDVGDLARAIELAQRGLGQLNGTVPTHYADYLGLGTTLASAYRERGDLVSAETLSRKVLQVAEQEGTPRARGEAYRAASLSAESSGDMRRALSRAARAIGAFSESEAHLQLARMKVVYARILLSANLGRSAEAIRLLAEASPVLRAAGTAADSAQCQLQLARGHLAAGRDDEAIALASDVAATARDVESAYGHLIVAQARLAAGLSDQAGQALEAARGRLSAAGPSSPAVRAWRELGDLYAQVGNAGRAIEAYGRALAMAGIPPLAFMAHPRLPERD